MNNLNIVSSILNIDSNISFRLSENGCTLRRSLVSGVDSSNQLCQCRTFFFSFIPGDDLIDLTKYQVITSLCEFTRGIREADDRIDGLCKELVHMTGLIGTVEKMLGKCGSLDLDLIDDDLWRNCDIAVGNCYITLAGLRSLVEKIKGPVKQKTRRFPWRVRVAVDLNVHGRDLHAFREKIHKSNLALQTMLQTLTV